MSLGKRVPLGMAQDLSKLLARMLEPSCEKVIVAGSVRRCKPMVGDVEIVALARESQVQDLFGASVSIGRTSVDDALDQFHEIENQGWRIDERKQGKVVKRLRHIHTNIIADVYVITDRRAWGSHVAIRTGPVGLSKMIVTKAREMGMSFSNGFLLHNHPKRRSGCRPDCKDIIPLLQEVDVFERLKIPYLSPQAREERYGSGL